MAIDRETIVSLHKKGESNSTIGKRASAWDGSNSAWDGLESGQKVQGDRPDIQSTGPGQKENSSNQANGVKY